MHGRLKVKTTAEQQEAKRKEREKKLKIYNSAVQKIFAKRKAEEYDEEGLHLSGEVLTANSDFYSLWNFRKEIFLHLKKEKTDEELQALFLQELYFLETCLKGNPKSYGTWHHRCFVLNNTPQPDWKRELQLCNKFLEYDERNFHCWDYRRFVVARSKVSPLSEFEFTTDKISSNFSNYSSWHYRSKLLPSIFPDPGQPNKVKEEQILKEYETVQNAFFTDPDDQSAWFYHRWLLGRRDIPQKICQMYVSRARGIVLVSLSRHIQVPTKDKLVLELNGSLLECKWKNQLGKTTYSTLWLASDLDIPAGEVSMKVRLEESDVSGEIHLGADGESMGKILSSVSSFSSELSAATSDVLKRELEAVQELITVEPDNKWALLTSVLLMKALSSVQYKSEILACLEKLESLDNMRRQYYLDLRSKTLVENCLQQFQENITDSLDLSDQRLTCMFHQELLPLLKELNLQKNRLCSLKNFRHLQCLVKLNVRGNCITTCDEFSSHPTLQEINLQNNSLSTAAALEGLATCPKLKTIQLQGNPVCDDNGAVEELKRMFAHVELVL